MARVEIRPEEPKYNLASDHVFSTDLQKTFIKYWHTSRDFKDTNLEVISKPFRVCRISNFLKNKEIIEQVKNELLDIKFRRHIIDLYQFERTGELSIATKTYIKMLHKTLQKDLTSWMERNTRITLNGKISMSSASYYDTDHLLCHDDNLEDRRIAFILYLMDEWSVEDGGALDLFDTDEHGLPKNVVRSLVPEYNSFVFFEVLDNSYHQVAEVTSHEKCRWSINGWFHGSIRDHQKPERPIKINLVDPDSNEIQLDSWIFKHYLTPDIVKQIQQEVEANSYSFLQGFFKRDMYEKILTDLTSENISWKMVGPADERRYEVADEQTLPQLLKDFCNLFKSISLFQLLKDYTELDLVPVSETMKPKMTIELQRWSTGCYTLIGNKKDSNESIDSDQLWESYDIDQSDDVEENDDDENNDVDQNDNIDHYDEVDQYDEMGRYEDHQYNVVDRYDDVNQYGDVGRDNEKDRMASEDFICSIEYPELKFDCMDSEKTISGHTTPSNVVPREEDEFTDINEVCKHVMSKNLKRKLSPSPQSSPSKSEISSKIVKKEDSSFNENVSDESSDIEDYLSHSSDASRNTEQSLDSSALDLIIQFHTGNAKDLDDMIDYVSPQEPGGELLHIPAKDNHLCLVYKTSSISRLHRYINHYCRGYFYNLICTYYE